MQSLRLVAVATLSATLLLTACSDSTDDGASTGSSSGEATSAGGDPAQSTSGDAASATGDTGEATAGADDDVVTAAPVGEGVISLEEAEGLARTLLTRAAESTQVDGEPARQGIVTAYRGAAREAALAADQLEPVAGEPPERNLEADPVEPNVLAVSRADEQSPELILVQTTPKGDLPELHLLSRPATGGGFRIMWSAPMLPETEVGTFDRRSVGSPVLRSGGGDFVTPPGTALTGLADYIDYPPSDAPDVRTNGYAPLVRKSATEQAQQVAAQATLRETNSLTKDDYWTLVQEDGTGITFGVLDRETVFDVRAGSQLIPPDTFTTFNDDEVLTDRATLDTLVFVAMRLPAQDGPPELIAAREQIVGASGS
ncbi:MAG: hypothetical protein ACR2FV_11225 [Ornithinimicrobium sp.]|uniref:hypothetical protein n=1 Tax=Ornithinimicrobium sp. TaxID=1977084 RepID=UPI003D9B1DA9